ncbi:DUF3290 family protein [Bombilactobacillus thymidiniphilus]|uniref:DUF3290 domain-containing protein n=1 Tax=Bombilactobacillus thymidiniphilus TaxID=2923363 RepID=A0ABY4PE41_9LACO|nr:DUF3290 family protein [Bombilactobacillus thymidiniphilus]UQS83781.1 DUF3290 domain-containing protein [Bombilactobacillus thymidiniphilus]
MTNFYTYQYLTHQPNRINSVIFVINILLVIALIIFLFLFLRHRDNGKYHGLTIIAILGLLLTLTIQYDNWTKDQSNLTGNGQVAGIIKQVATNKKTSPNNVYSNSTSLTDGMILKIRNSFFEVKFNTDNSSYHLEKTQLVDPKINIIKN